MAKSNSVLLFSVLFFILLFTQACNQNSEPLDVQTIQTDLLIAGGGASGSAAAIQAARDGVNVVVVEPSPWLGGMLTAAGVSATDGNHNLPSGIWGEFREKLREHYGGAEALATGWISHTLFEPHVGNRILNEMMDGLPNIQRIHGYYIDEAIMIGNRVAGATFFDMDGNRLRVEAAISIDATEYGDLMARSGADYFIGLDPISRTGEEIAPTHGNNMIQDLTYTATLKDYGPDADMTIPRPANYQPSIFMNACKELSDNPETFDGVDCIQMMDYARLPNDKFLINWPNYGNDYYLNVLEMDHHERLTLYEEAKNRTRQFIYFIQTEGGFKNLGFADDEYSTDDLFPYIPYHRESRRLDGLTMLTMNELTDPYGVENDLYKTAIGVGDYPLDHHRDLNPSPPANLLEEGDREPYQFETRYEAFPGIPSFSVPFGALIPKTIDGLLVAEKSISVSSIANGSSRLQPVVMTIGQAAGVAAAIAVQENLQPRDLPLRQVQQVLLDTNSWALPFIDTTPDDWHFQPLQRAGLSGILKGEGVPYAWANQTWIYPDSTMSTNEISEALSRATDAPMQFDPEDNTRADVVFSIWQQIGSPSPGNGGTGFSDISADHTAANAIQYGIENGWFQDWITGDLFEPDSPIKRKEFAKIVDSALDTFNNLPIAIVPDRYNR
ncbi:MAG: FAD-dependent oxidoreductase [Balneolaceae bacterium]|nr:FAD-dependent oxidoreductase [Balneolaceae bacterium]